jgi:hypothetical protein
MIRTMIAASAMAVAMVSAATTGPSSPTTVADKPAAGDAQSAAGNAQRAAGDAQPAAGHAQPTDLILSYLADAGYATAVKLHCNPARGAHPYPAQACNTLTRVGGRPDLIKPARMMCMMIYAPITAEMTGIWKGKSVRWSKKYGNSCEMTRATGILFRF